MILEKIENKELQRLIKNACGKKTFAEVTEEDIENIRTFIINTRLINGQESGIGLEVLDLLPNLEELGLHNMILNQEQLARILSMKKLRMIKFNSCGFDEVDFDKFDKELPEHISFGKCSLTNIKYPKVSEVDAMASSVDFESIDFSLVKRIKMVNCKVTNAHDLDNYPDIESVYLNGSELYADGEKLLPDISVSKSTKYSHEIEERFIDV